MPVLECTAKLRAADPKTIFNLATVHRLEYKDSISALKSRFPDSVDVLPASVIVFQISAVFNRKRLSTEALRHSQLSTLFAEFLKENASQLGLNTVSNLYVQDESDKLQLHVTVNRTRLPVHEAVPVRVKLRAIHLQYSITTKEPSDEDHLLSARLSLPYRTLAEDLLKRFVTYQLVRRYPFVFGALSQQLDIETRFFKDLFISLYEMAERSPNQDFQARFRRLIKILKRQQQASHVSSLASFTSLLQPGEFSSHDGHGDSGESKPGIHIGSEAAFFLAMENLFKRGMKRPRFKPITAPNLIMTTADTQDDDELVVARDYRDPDADVYVGSSTAPSSTIAACPALSGGSTYTPLALARMDTGASLPLALNDVSDEEDAGTCSLFAFEPEPVPTPRSSALSRSLLHLQPLLASPPPPPPLSDPNSTPLPHPNEQGSDFDDFEPVFGSNFGLPRADVDRRNPVSTDASESRREGGAAFDADTVPHLDLDMDSDAPVPASVLSPSASISFFGTSYPTLEMFTVMPQSRPPSTSFSLNLDSDVDVNVDTILGATPRSYNEIPSQHTLRLPSFLPQPDFHFDFDSGEEESSLLHEEEHEGCLLFDDDNNDVFEGLDVYMGSNSTASEAENEADLMAMDVADVSSDPDNDDDDVIIDMDDAGRCHTTKAMTRNGWRRAGETKSEVTPWTVEEVQDDAYEESMNMDSDLEANVDTDSQAPSSPRQLVSVLPSYQNYPSVATCFSPRISFPRAVDDVVLDVDFDMTRETDWEAENTEMVFFSDHDTLPFMASNFSPNSDSVNQPPDFDIEDVGCGLDCLQSEFPDAPGPKTEPQSFFVLSEAEESEGAISDP